ncbi:MAG TPA: zinc-ribbon domain-containing protein, partial [Thermomicrobiales bacterium]|nr:zinc-ribbon domain-containing protein [Thermomicrobiales bacterium]
LLLSAAVASAWVEPWGALLAQRFALDVNVARFAVTIGIFAIGLVGLGWIGGGAAGLARPTIAGRLAGGALGAMNGAFLLAQILAAVERDLQVGAMTGSVIGGELLRDRDRLLLGAALVALAIAVAARLVRTIRGEPATSDVGLGVGLRQRPVRLAAGADAGKYEPEAAAAPDGRPLGETAALPYRPEGTASPAAKGGAWWRPSPPAPLPTNGHRPTGLPEDWSHAAEPGASWQARRDQAYNQTVEFPAGGAGGRRFGGASQTGQNVDDRERCPTCGSHVTANDLFCPSCGKTL